MSTQCTSFTFGEQTLRVTFDYSPGTPDVMYLPNGDPGYPGDPEEFEPTRFELETLVTDDLVAQPGSLRVIWLDISEMIWALGEQAVERVTAAAYASALADLEDQAALDAEDRAMAQAEARELDRQSGL
jgi:hypothetical protein